MTASLTRQQRRHKVQTPTDILRKKRRPYQPERHIKYPLHLPPPNKEKRIVQPTKNVLETISKPGLMLLNLEMLSVPLHTIRDGVADYLGGLPNPRNLLTYKRRLYVSIHGQESDLYLVVDGEQRMSHPLLSSIPNHLYQEVIWSPMIYQTR